MSEYRVKGIARYVHLMRSSGQPDATPEQLKFSINVLIHKSDPECVKVQSQIDELIKSSYPNGTPANFKSCWKDCALHEKDKENPALTDYMALNCGSFELKGIKPTVLDSNKQIVIDPEMDAIALGKIVYVCYGLGLYNKAGNQGCSAYLNATLVTDELGDIPLEYLSARPTAEALFADIQTSSPIATPPTPAANTIVTPPAPPAPYPVAPPPVANTPSPVAPPPPAVKVMTALAAGATYEAMRGAGWTDSQLIEKGYMQPPHGVVPSFA